MSGLPRLPDAAIFVDIRINGSAGTPAVLRISRRWCRGRRVGRRDGVRPCRCSWARGASSASLCCHWLEDDELLVQPEQHGLDARRERAPKRCEQRAQPAIMRPFSVMARANTVSSLEECRHIIGGELVRSRKVPPEHPFDDAGVPGRGEPTVQLTLPAVRDASFEEPLAKGQITSLAAVGQPHEELKRVVRACWPLVARNALSGTRRYEADDQSHERLVELGQRFYEVSGAVANCGKRGAVANRFRAAVIHAHHRMEDAKSLQRARYPASAARSRSWPTVA